MQTQPPKLTVPEHQAASVLGVDLLGVGMNQGRGDRAGLAIVLTDRTHRGDFRRCPDNEALAEAGQLAGLYAAPDDFKTSATRRINDSCPSDSHKKAVSTRRAQDPVLHEENVSPRAFRRIPRSGPASRASARQHSRFAPRYASIWCRSYKARLLSRARALSGDQDADILLCHGIPVMRWG
jgi:hypothetical protein